MLPLVSLLEGIFTSCTTYVVYFEMLGVKSTIQCFRRIRRESIILNLLFELKHVDRSCLRQSAAD